MKWEMTFKKAEFVEIVRIFKECVNHMSTSFGSYLIIKDNVAYEINDEESIIVIDGDADELVGYLIGFFSSKLLSLGIRFEFLKTGYDYFDQDDD